MFGYVKSDYANLYVRDTVLYKAMYCGLCKSIGATCGQKARFVLNYDLAFLSVWLHNVMGVDIVVNKEHCVVHPIVKKPIANVDELSKRIASLNVILAHYKIEDSIIDKDGGRIKKSFLRSSYKKAKALEPQLDEIVKNRYKELRELELKNVDSIDLSADPFGNMLKDVVKVLTGEEFNENIGEIAYNLGKWIYLIDAIDDYDKDLKKKSFNVFVNAYGFMSKEKLLKEKKQDIINAISPAIMRIGEKSRLIKYKFNHDLCDNILNRGLILETKRILEREKCKNCTKF